MDMTFHNDIQSKIKDMISHVFGKYDMRLGEDNLRRLKSLLNFCMSDIENHPNLASSLQTNDELEFYVVQSIIYMMR